MRFETFAAVFCLAISENRAFFPKMKTLILLGMAALLASCATRGGCCSEGAAGRNGGEALGKTR
jgi:hypothetical protein